TFLNATEKGAEIAVRRVLQRQAVIHVVWGVATKQREDVEQADCARMIVEQPAEIRLAHPAVDVRADLDTDDLRHRVRAPIAMGEIHLAEATFTEQALDAIAQ